MSVRNLLGDVVTPQSRGRYAGGLGCEYCPLDGIPGINKVQGLVNIKQRRAMAWAESPGDQENRKRLALVGPSGQLLWEAAASVGLSRSDFDVQNVVRCQPKDADGIKHKPTKRELQCCSVYTDEALQLNAEHAVVHFVMGEIAGGQLFGKSYSKEKPIFWHEPWNAYVVLANHPSFLLRIERETGKRGYHYRTFKERLQAVKVILEHPGKWGYVKAQDYSSVVNHSQMQKLREMIQIEVKAGRRVSMDIEDGIVNGKRVVLMVGFGAGRYTGKGYTGWKGWARSVVLYHPQADQSPERIEPLIAMLKEIIEDPSIKKTLQHGNYDDEQTQNLLGAKLQGYDWDTQYSCYMHSPGFKQGYSLEVLINRHLLEFADYKTGMTAGYKNYADIPLEQLVLYNCADCDVEKRLECHTASRVNPALLKVYIHDAYVLEDMESRGPILDRKNLAGIRKRIMPQIEYLRTALIRLSSKTDFNPDSTQDIAWLMFDKLKLPEIEGRSTDAEYLEILARKHNSKPARMVIQYRALRVIERTFCLGYEVSADLHEGHLSTIWHLTGAATGRLRSGRGKEAELEGVVNFQNVHGNRILQNMLVSDPNWRLALNGKP